jgi:class 3 adenylate cyclase/serine/threonine protein kinase
MTDVNHLEPQSAPMTRLAVLLFTDIVGSTEFKGRMRAGEYAQLLARHNELFEASLREFRGAEVIKHTGDGYFAMFPAASDAVRFALQFEDRMKREDWGAAPMRTRVGIHVGEVAPLDMAGRRDIVGLGADVAARIMSLATGGQVLLTAQAFNDARQSVGQSTGVDNDAKPLRWIAHGPYLFKGTDQPLDVYEVGIEGASPLMRPPDGEKARRVVPHDQEATLGWRPAVALEVPGRSGWVLEQKLGDGGFGEVWLGFNHKLNQRRVFKFCFDVERLRSFKRELTLFRLLREALGQRHDIATLYEVKLDEPPFFLESEYTAGGNLQEWAQRLGGIGTLSMSQRLDLVARVADAVAAAHSVGVLHKDIKPSNILVQQNPDGTIQPRLADFGIGILSDRSQLRARAITETGFTQFTRSDAATSGTRMYAPPESLLNKPFTTQGDVFALGVLLYQVVVGDLTRPLASGWERDVTDDVLREDIASMVEGDPEVRLATAAAVAQRVRSVEPRRRQRAAQQQLDRQMARRIRLMRVGIAAMIVLAIAVTLVAIALSRERRLRAAAEDATRRSVRAEQQTQETLAMTLAQSARLARSRGDLRSAVDYYRRAIDSGYSDRIAMQLGIVEVLVWQDDRPAAEAELTRLAGESPGAAELPRFKMLKGLILRRSGTPVGILGMVATNLAPNPRYDEGLKLLRESVKQGLDPADDAWARAELATTMPEALELLQQALEHDPYHREASKGAALLLLLLGRHDHAIAAFQSLKLLAPDDPIWQLGVAFSHAVRGQTEQLERDIADFGQAARIRQQKLVENFLRLIAKQSREMRDGTLAQSQILPELIRQFAAQGAAAGDDATGMFQIGGPPCVREVIASILPMSMALAFGQYDAALTRCDRLVEQWPTADAYSIRASIHFYRNDWVAAEQDAARAVEHSSAFGNESYHWYVLANMRAALVAGYAGEAQPQQGPGLAEALRRAMSLGAPPSNVDFLLLMDSAQSAGESDLCREMIARELRRRPDDGEVLRARMRVEYRAGNYGAAVVAADEYLKRAAGDADALEVRADAIAKLGLIGPPGAARSIETYQRQRAPTAAPTQPSP